MNDDRVLRREPRATHPGRRDEAAVSAAQSTQLLEELVYELLDAHSDTAALVAPPRELAWDAHLDYLGALQRRARAILAEATATTNGVLSD